MRYEHCGIIKGLLSHFWRQEVPKGRLNEAVNRQGLRFFVPRDQRNGNEVSSYLEETAYKLCKWRIIATAIVLQRHTSIGQHRN